MNATRHNARSGAARRERPDRKREILDAALECFATQGYATTTLADIRERAGASTGSIYHHFTNKAEIAAELYLVGVRSTQENGLRALATQTDVEGGVKALVISYLDWVRDHPKFARFLFAMRHADFMKPVEPKLARMNRATRRTANAWFEGHMASGELPKLAPDLLRAVVYGPVSYFSRRMLEIDASAMDLERALCKSRWITAVTARQA
jgi:AcrR family transcriptional regulator